MANGNNGNGAPKPVGCAIYTRKSSDEGLNQDFNSLDAQRDAGEAYIRSQAGEGWTLVPDQYDDGGYTGANMDRPAVKRPAGGRPGQEGRLRRGLQGGPPQPLDPRLRQDHGGPGEARRKVRFGHAAVQHDHLARLPRGP
jgi:hypothetical protein